MRKAVTKRPIARTLHEFPCKVRLKGLSRGALCRGSGQPRTEVPFDRSGFTLVEVLLVVVIIMISAGLAIPSFVRSYRGAKLRTSARTIVMASRYARSVAVLQQVQTSLLLDTELDNLEVIAMESEKSNEDGFLDEGTDGGGGESFSVTAKLKKYMPEGVEITDVEVTRNAEQEKDGISWINYYPNGMCDGFTVSLKDDRDSSLTIEVDPLSAKSSIDYEP